jgi:hypothetical protein
VWRQTGCGGEHVNWWVFAPWLRAGALCARQLPLSMGLYDGLQGLGGGQPEMGGPVPFTALLSISNGMLLGPPSGVWG